MRKAGQVGNRVRYRDYHKRGGTAAVLVDVAALEANVNDAELENKRLGDTPKPVSHDHELNTARMVSTGKDQIQWRHLLIDYRNGNKVLLERWMTRFEAWRKNQHIKGSGRAWAVCQG